MIQSLLIANRGEIACRVIRTARKLGIRTVAVYSEADANALHVRMADDAVAIGPAPARESYLVGERIIAAAKSTGAEAIHPGYGFLSENADFAEAVIAAGLIWVGPKPASIRAMGLKDAAKERMIAAGVPVTPGYLGEDQSPDRLQAEADAIGYPVLIKAVAGGGGKGMRRVESAADFRDALASCQREAASSFGDDRVLIEKYILSPRHIEVQVFGDTHGNVVHLFERDCSLQRRHQKVIEEAPAPGMDAETREAVCGAAVRAAQAVDYVGAGTIEFIADASEGLRADRIWFMEMNTRLQVEHPVTEEITGQDLVEWQLRVASGEPLPKRQEELSINGWAMEARLYAEDPAKGFLPSAGRIDHWVIPSPTDIDVRIESSLNRTDVIQTFYDPMIAKIIVHAATREAAINGLAEVCAGTEVAPITTNAGFLAKLLRRPEFKAGAVTTGFIGSEEASLTDTSAVINALKRQAGIALLVQSVRPLSGKTYGTVASELQSASCGNVWRECLGFRLNQENEFAASFFVDGKRETIVMDGDWTEEWVSTEPAEGGLYVFDEGEKITIKTRYDGNAAGALSDGALTAPMPGRVVAVEVAAGDAVTKGQRIVVIEAMKMEQALLAPFDGIVAEIGPAAGAQVSEGTLLARIEASEG
ncbi:acetyl/propionyl/methylcrotonyl-CoA carboxylase subunit alpha [Sphingomonas oryzagri]|uniref:Acetyl/propionyl/methylcrotonyl-CoA carboxylase subunit alpha n=1 Tax=Sphingomonas oryzagri TaxID=3042314 RepID=A0ABT6N6Q2_9SPHN|nr:acetyl/propionyl/methylcrotonyl-CoA carboxylase subunit alpha [Sphingomonas oryzagri]MDH7640776.1 acetyl/propionyl/methylcrotonyl-CoA carboxylase subunit alpha [Sphingomonas oryzagri]